MKRSILVTFIAIMVVFGSLVSFEDQAKAEPVLQSDQITIRTENFPRPPYSGATYYIYERGGETICTKLEVCNKYDNCSTSYNKGVFKDEIDVETGDPYGTTDPVVIPKNKLKRHVCLKRFGLLKK